MAQKEKDLISIVYEEFIKLGYSESEAREISKLAIFNDGYHLNESPILLGYKKGRWDMFERISSCEYGKQCYFQQNDDTIYSRRSCKCMSFDDAVKEFCDTLFAQE